ncbi:pyruvate kinase [Rosistilla oblonga]|uniref:pyruvate kinase n=1 Tax=Rosistilla oblonga TaxID=2527990 RepID=UPI003A971463
MDIRQPVQRTLVLTVLFAALGTTQDAVGVEAVSRDFNIQPLERIPAGTVITPDGAKGWSDLLLFVNGSLGKGDVDAASSTVKHYASLFNIAYMANVANDAEGRFTLDKIGVGFTTKIDGQDVVITSDTHKSLGADLGMIGGAVFSANERALSEIVQVARYRDGAIFDAPTIMLRDGKHKKVIVRFFVWVSPQGSVGTVCWVLDGYGGSRYVVPNKEIVLLRPQLVENRVMHVDGDRFTLGIPSEDAFAVVSLPPGREYKIDDDLATLIAKKRYDAQSFFDTVQKLSKSLAAN